MHDSTEGQANRGNDASAPTRAETIFNQLRAINEPDARASALDQLCAGDMDLRGEVEGLLRAHDEATGFLVTNLTTAGARDPATPRRDREAPGTRIGPYKILQFIDEGGFGAVYMAEQDKPIRRRVALKIIKAGMDSRQVIARFEAERQALAMMNHPHIARVLDGGITDAGRPYFVMEYVVGDAVTKFADAHKLSVDERLALFQQVCQAVQHAHTKGVIHRDLKPGNVLVSMVDGRPFAKVIDFGIAKATGAAGERLTDKTLFTMHGQLIGTPEYMSPEQAGGDPDIDTRTDVYALGVLLYELLTGSTPFRLSELKRFVLEDIRKRIRESDPPSPSLRLSRDLETLAATAAARRVEPGKLGALVKGELDWIVMKALEKDRARRYETATALAADVGRHLAGEAVVAAPPSRVYRVRKFVRKHRGPVIAGSAVAAALLVGFAGTTWGLLRATRASARLAEQMDIARESLVATIVETKELDPAEREKLILNDGFTEEEAAREQALAYAEGVRHGRAHHGFGEPALSDVSLLAWMTQSTARDLLHTRDSLRSQTDAAEWSAYTANLALAQQAMEAGNYPEARQRLAECPEGKRGWEWRLLGNMAHGVVREFRGDRTAVSPDGKSVLAVAGRQALLHKVDSDDAPVRIQTDAPLIPNGEIGFSVNADVVALTTWESSEHSEKATRVFRADGTPVTDPEGAAIPGYRGWTFFLSPIGERAVSIETRNSHSYPEPRTDRAMLYASTGDILAELPQKGQDLTGAAFHPDGVRIVLTTRAGVMIWNPQTGLVTDLPLDPASYYYEPWLTDDGKYLVVWRNPRTTSEQMIGSKQVKGVVIVPLDDPGDSVTIDSKRPIRREAYQTSWEPGDTNGGPWIITHDTDGTFSRRDMRGQPIGRPLRFSGIGTSGLVINQGTGEVLVEDVYESVSAWRLGSGSATYEYDDESILLSDYYGIAKYDREGKLAARAMMPYSDKYMWYIPSDIYSVHGGILADIEDVESVTDASIMLFSRDIVSSVYFVPEHWHASLWVNASLGSVLPRMDTAQSSAALHAARELAPTATSFASLTDGSRVFAAVGRQVDVWNPATRRRIASFRMPYDIESLEVSADDGVLVAELFGGAAMFFDSRPVEVQHAEAARFGAEQDAARSLVDALIAGLLPIDELESFLVADTTVPPIRKLAAALLLENRIETIRRDSSIAFHALTEGQTDKAVVLESARSADTQPRVRELLVTMAEAWEYRPPVVSAEERLAEETIQRRLAQALAVARSGDAGASAVEMEQWQAAMRTALDDCISLVGVEHLTSLEVLRTAATNGVKLGPEYEATFRRAARAELAAGNFDVAVHEVASAWRHRAHAGGPPNPIDRLVFAIGLSRIREITAAYLEPPSKLPGLTGETEASRARNALAQARAIMSDPTALNDAGLPWSQDPDAVALLAEAEALIEGKRPGP